MLQIILNFLTALFLLEHDVFRLMPFFSLIIRLTFELHWLSFELTPVL